MLRLNSLSNQNRIPWWKLLAAIMAVVGPCVGDAADAVPDKIVVLTFDDSVRSQFDVVRPLLKQYGFGATFFITEGFEFQKDKQNYMTWDQIRQLHMDGFEIGNHTRDHVALSAENYKLQLSSIAARCLEHGIPAPVSYAYPGNTFTLEMLPWLAEHGIRFARRGGTPEFGYKTGKGVALEPGLDHPLLIPTAGDARPDWVFDDFLRAVMQAELGRIAVLQFHGVPDGAHNWVSTSADNFRAYMLYLKVNGFKVISLRELDQYMDKGMLPKDPQGVIQDRQDMMAKGLLRSEARISQSRRETAYWFNIMKRHGYTVAETRMASGLNASRADVALERAQIGRVKGGLLEVLPYPGGRHPRIGFRDGEIRPQRETKLSVFSPWSTNDYIVLDIPEAIWNNTPDGRELLYLAHKHIPTMWDKRDIVLTQGEWQTIKGGYESVRVFPNNVQLRTKVWPTTTGVKMEMQLTNNSKNPLTGLYTQNCAMLAYMDGFNQQTTDNKVFTPMAVACGNPTGTKWILYAWQACKRGWGSDLCPCLHSDPHFPDIPVGKSVVLRGWLSFYEGTEVDKALATVNKMTWLQNH
jgi:peptidoglycan/xylan/chitin deacetylase (PgdA/CDA1 family)